MTLGLTPFTVVSVTLPAGSYVLAVDGLLVGSGASFTCDLKTGGSSVETRFVYTSPTAPHNDFSMLHVATVAAGGATYALKCSSTVAGTAPFGVTLTATRVGTLHAAP